MFSLRCARRDVCYSVGAAVERLLITDASTVPTARFVNNRPLTTSSEALSAIPSTASSRTRGTNTDCINHKRAGSSINCGGCSITGSRRLSDTARARIELSAVPAAHESSHPNIPPSVIPQQTKIPNIQNVAAAAAKILPTLANIPGQTTMDITSTSITTQPPQEQQEIQQYFRFEDYDCVGFDLDNTICRYKVSNMVKLEYKALSDYLIHKCGYSPKYLSLPVEDGVEFMIKGLILDVMKGNILRIAPDGKILHGSHGTKELSKQQLFEYYGAEMRWEVTDLFIRDPLHTWNGPLSQTMRTLSDYFDMPASLVFARAVDTLDEDNNGCLEQYNIYPHIQDALQDMFQKDHFSTSKGGYFPDIKQDPDNYIHKCSGNLIDWLWNLKKANKKLFLITGSNVDFATHTASRSLGPNWQDLFEIVICFAKKPGFFTQNRDFLALDGFVETHQVHAEELQAGQIYTAGNWAGVFKFLQKSTGKISPQIVYIGDHLIQDVYTPSAHTDCHTVAICEELEAEGVFGHEKTHHDDDFLVSTRWGSYFHHEHIENVWMDFLRKHAKLVVPSLEYVAKFPIYHQFPSLQ